MIEFTMASVLKQVVIMPIGSHSPSHPAEVAVAFKAMPLVTSSMSPTRGVAAALKISCENDFMWEGAILRFGVPSAPPDPTSVGIMSAASSS